MPETLRMGLIGAGISFSKMPRLQRYLGVIAGIDINYQLIDAMAMTSFDPMEQITLAIEQGFHGLNVTHPYKQRVRQLVEQALVDEHARIGSYNTLKFQDGHVFGANTDFSGFRRGYRYRRGDQSTGRVLICGAGGVGRAVAYSLVDLDCRQVDIYDLDESQSRSLATELADRGVEARFIEADEFSDAVRAADGLVNCTSLGMYSYPGTPIHAKLIGGQNWAFDAVYTPMTTAFLTHCRHTGLQVISGFDLWFFQGLDAFRIFTGVEVDASEELISHTLTWMNDAKGHVGIRQ